LTRGGKIQESLEQMFSWIVQSLAPVAWHCSIEVKEQSML